MPFEENSSESECDWEEVPETQAPKEVQLTFESAEQRKQRIAEEKEQQCVEREIRRELNRIEQEKQILKHKGELVWFLMSYHRVNMAICNNELLQSLLLSTFDLNEIITPCKTTKSLIKFLEYISKKLKDRNSLEGSPCSNNVYFQRYQKWKLISDVIAGKKQIKTYFDWALLYTLAIRSVGLRCRLVCSFQPVTFKFATAKKIAISKFVANKMVKIPQFDGAGDSSDELISNKKPRTRRTTKRKFITKSPAEKLSKMMKMSQNENKKLKNTSKTSTTKNKKNKVEVEKKEKELKINSRKLRSAAIAMKNMKEEHLSDEESVYFQSKKKRLPSKVLASANENTKIKIEKDRDFKIETKTKKIKSISKKSTKKSSTKKGFKFWVEVFNVEKKEWTSVDCRSGKFDCPSQIEQDAEKPLHYVVGFDEGGFVKDVTPRYCSDWMTKTKKLRYDCCHSDDPWWCTTLMPYTDKKEFAREERQIRDILLSLPIPSSISNFKNHQLFFLRRHLLKYEAIYPEDTKPLSFIRGEAILPRTCVHVLMSREKWLQQGKQVKDGEKPYKMVASAIINKKLGKSSDHLSLPLFGKWQTEKYTPPVARNGIVPRNNHNNVDLFQPEMIPIGCVHIRHLGNLKRVARKLNIDCVEAVVGFDSHSGKSHPVTEGFVVCAEFEEVLRQACREDSIIQAQQRKKKRRQRAVANWKLLFRTWRAKRKVEKKYVIKKDKITGVSIEEEDSFQSTQTWQADKLKSQKQNEGKKIGSRCRGKKQPESKIKVPLPFTE